jgi:hypothetical protein
LARACDALRAAIEHAPHELSHWLGLCELLQARGLNDATNSVGQTARALGLEHPDLPNELQPGLGAAALRDHVLPHLALRGALEPLRVLLCELSYALEAQLPFEGPCQTLQGGLAERIAAEVMPLFGLHELQLASCEASVCLPLSAAPARLCLGSAWLAAASASERSFALIRALAIARFDLVLLVRSTPERLGLVLSALRQVVDRSHTVTVVDAAEQARVANELSARIAESERLRARNLFDEMADREEVTPRRLIASAYDVGSRVALSVTGDVASAFASLLRLRGRAPHEFSQAEKLELCRTEPSLRGLLSFAISEAYSDVRREALREPADTSG